MAVTVNVYDHTVHRFVSGLNAADDTYKINLYTALTFDATHTTKAAVGGTQVSTANGYTQDTKALADVVISLVTTNDAMFDASNVVWSASGGTIVANYALIYNDSDTDDPPVCVIDFGGAQTAVDGADFKINFNADGILKFALT